MYLHNIYPLSRIHNTSLGSAYFGLDKRDKKIKHTYSQQHITLYACSLILAPNALKIRAV
jgi:hypothetical protein